MGCVWRPLAVNDVSIAFNMESKVLIATTEFFEASFSVFYCLDPLLGMTVSAS